jgi:type II secretory pathway pseudopilin PulG
VRQRAQHGFVLISLVALLVMGALAFLVSNLSPELLQAYRQRQTDAALMQAREALIGYALQYRDKEASQGRPGRMYGYLPLPDLGSSRNNNSGCGIGLEGCDAANFVGNAFDANGIGPTVVGRFPWRTLGTEPLRDSNGECLWLIVSSLHSRIQRSSPPPILPPMNWDTLGQLDIVVANGTTALHSTLASPTASAHDRPIAIIFSPGPPLPGQVRSKVTPPTDDVTECGGQLRCAQLSRPRHSRLRWAASPIISPPRQMPPVESQGIPIQAMIPIYPRHFPFKALFNRPVTTSFGRAAVRRALRVRTPPTTRDSRSPATSCLPRCAKSSLFRLDINSMLDRMTSCLRDIGVTASAHPLASNPCYDDTQDPQNYFSNYKDQIFVSPCAGNCAVTIDGTAPATVCPAVLVFSSQRNKPNQVRLTLSDKADPNNYLEAPNANSFITAGANYAGVSTLSRVTTPHLRISGTSCAVSRPGPVSLQ